MTTLTGKTVLIAGGTGGVGEGLVRAFLKSGATVIVPSRTESKLDRLRDYTKDITTGKLVGIHGTVTDEETALALGEKLLKEFRSLDVAIASLGGWSQGYPISSTPMDVWNKVIRDNLTSHFLAMKTFVPLLNAQSGIYVHVNGFSADEPYPMAGPVAMTAAAQKSLTLTLSKELDRTGIRVFEFILGPMKTRDRLKHHHGQDDWYFPEEIGLKMIETFDQPRHENIVHYLLKK
jgi:NAD(P)-dependent dehydrogenase (short-subunit alcohol dehydrogenase family)